MKGFVMLLMVFLITGLAATADAAKPAACSGCTLVVPVEAVVVAPPVVRLPRTAVIATAPALPPVVAYGTPVRAALRWMAGVRPARPKALLRLK